MKKGLLIAFVAFPLIGFGGAYFAASKGIINVPGITPKKVAKLDPKAEQAAKDAAAKAEAEKKPKVKIEEKPKEVLKPKKPTQDPEKGIEMVADVWGNLKADQLAPIAERYKDKDLAPILLMLDSKKTAALLALMKPERAEKLSREIQRQASVIESPS